MCGIVGCVSERPVLPVLLDGLRRLEYRGYDSAGVAGMSADSTIYCCKAAGKLDAKSGLAAKLVGVDLADQITTGIAHTRWATHGEPNENNAHPHLDGEGRVAIVHNGVLENYRELKAWLNGHGHQLRTDTDSEILAILIGIEHNGGSVSLEQAVMNVLGRHQDSSDRDSYQIVGTFGLAVR